MAATATNVVVQPRCTKVSFADTEDYNEENEIITKNILYRQQIQKRQRQQKQFVYTMKNHQPTKTDHVATFVSILNPGNDGDQEDLIKKVLAKKFLKTCVHTLCKSVLQNAWSKHLQLHDDDDDDDDLLQTLRGVANIIKSEEYGGNFIKMCENLVFTEEEQACLQALATAVYIEPKKPSPTAGGLQLSSSAVADGSSTRSKGVTILSGESSSPRNTPAIPTTITTTNQFSSSDSSFVVVGAAGGGGTTAGGYVMVNQEGTGGGGGGGVDFGVSALTLTAPEINNGDGGGSVSASTQRMSEIHNEEDNQGHSSSLSLNPSAIESVGSLTMTGLSDVLPASKCKQKPSDKKAC